MFKTNVARKDGLTPYRFQPEGYTHTLEVPLAEDDYSPAAFYVELTATEKRSGASPGFLKASDGIEFGVQPVEAKLVVDVSAEETNDASTRADQNFLPPNSPQLSSEHLYGALRVRGVAVNFSS